MTEVPLLSPFYRWGNWPFQDHTTISGRVRITAQILSNFRICPSTLHCIASNDSGLIYKINKRGKFVLLVTNFKNILETEGTFQNMNNSQIQSYNIIFIPKYILIMMEISQDGLPTNTISPEYSFMFIIENLMGTLYIFCPVLLWT